MDATHGTKLIDPRDYQPPLLVPDGYDRNGILESLASVSIDGSAASELRTYATHDLERFLHTLAMVETRANGRMLEIGANPYFTTLLFKHFRPGIELSLVNYFGRGAVDSVQEVQFDGFDGGRKQLSFGYQNLNIEEDDFPFPAASFDYILFCEVLEHLTNNPLRAIRELKRLLKPGGVLVLTTPNAARLENLMAFVEGRNIYDPYSAYGPYGRHNREYTRHELHELMAHAGFSVENSYTANVHDDLFLPLKEAAELNAVIRGQPSRQWDLGQYLITKWRNDGNGKPGLPAWLYRSYPLADMA